MELSHVGLKVPAPFSQTEKTIPIVLGHAFWQRVDHHVILDPFRLMPS